MQHKHLQAGSGFRVDPIEKKPLYHFLPATPVLSFGTADHHLGCRFCENCEISKSRDMDTLAVSALPEAIAEAAVRLGCKSVAFAYNGSVVFHEYAIDVARACRQHGIRTVAVRAQKVCAEARAEFYEQVGGPSPRLHEHIPSRTKNLQRASPICRKARSSQRTQETTRGHAFRRNPLCYKVGATGFEPATS